MGAPPRSHWLRRGLLYCLFTIAAYLVSLWVLLPYPQLARKAEAFLRGHDIEAEIRDLGPGLPLGLKASSVQLAPTSDLGWEGIELQNVSVSLQPGRLLRGEGAFGIRAELLGGDLTAVLTPGELTDIEATWSQLDLGRIVLPDPASELPIRGLFGGSLQAQVNRARPDRPEGNLEARISTAGLGAGRVQGIPVPDLDLGTGTFRAAASSDGKVDVESAEFQGGDLGLTFSGSVTLREPLDRSPVIGVLSLLPGDKAAEDLALLFALFPGPKASDGRYTAMVRGNLAAPRLLRR